MAFNPGSKRFSSGIYAVSSRPEHLEMLFRHHEYDLHNHGDNMSDGGVVREDSSAQRAARTVLRLTVAEVQRQQLSRAIARKREKEQTKFLKIPAALMSRPHVEVQTDLYLQETAVVVDTRDMHSQTDVHMEKPPSPPYIPAKIGKDFEGQAELFDFDVEVQPVAEVLVHKTIEQTIMEVMEEEELACLREQQRVSEELRAREFAEVMRLQEQERHHTVEKERRITEQREVLEKERETSEKVAARAYTQQYLADLLPAVVTTLRCDGYFYDPVERDIELEFLPWLKTQLLDNMDKRTMTRQILDTIILNIAQMRQDRFK
ncbi:radial spoke head protein 3 homolog B-like [Solea solea]|uniref:radial spoke head protein 3 homolog B-like n=1 Tax=Solea solea TaxID=90069 RepID=UPI00272D74EC|nr:radial spoke head protein 3 homolog B-like [Solea solea]